MEKAIKQRAKEAMKQLEISATAVAKFRGLNDRTTLDQINGNSKIGVATIEALLAYRPTLSAEWLLRGKGSMLTSESAPIDEDMESLKETIRRQQREIDGLYERIAELKGGNTTAARNAANIG